MSGTARARRGRGIGDRKGRNQEEGLLTERSVSEYWKYEASNIRPISNIAPRTIPAGAPSPNVVRRVAPPGASTPADSQKLGRSEGGQGDPSMKPPPAPTYKPKFRLRWSKCEDGYAGREGGDLGEALEGPGAFFL
jgi:hypothetical protein